MVKVLSVYGYELYKDSVRTVKKLVAAGVAHWIDHQSIRMERPTESEMRLYKLRRDGVAAGDWRVVQPNFDRGGCRVISQWVLS